MASSYLNRKLPIAATHGFILLYIIIEWGRKIFNVLTSQFSLTKASLSSSSNYTTSQDSELYSFSVSRDEVETVLAKLGIFCHPEEPQGEERLSSNHFSALFAEEEVFQVDEVKAAFDVFDQNKDGFIDDKELQRVLCALGFKEGFELENCRNMIKMFDEDGDGRIDFSEFSALF